MENFERSMTGKVTIPDLKPMTNLASEPGDQQRPQQAPPQGQVERPETKTAAESSTTTPTQSVDHQCDVDDEPPRMYGYWKVGPGPKAHKPWALILFSGRSRPGDLQHALCSKGWRVCAIDIAAPRRTDLLCEATWENISMDLVAGKYKALWIATPCETFSPLREKQPGPRVLRTLEAISGLPKSQLTQAEQKQIKESNILVTRTYTAASAQTAAGNPWGIENPDHGDHKPSLWKMPAILELFKKADGDIKFDQCRTGLETVKPTRLLVKGLDLPELQGLRCNHEPQEFTRPDGSKYKAAHQSTVQRWITNDKGERERASKSQGEYTSQLSEVIARAFHASQAGAGWLRKELACENL